MAIYTQANQPLALSTPLGPDALLLAGLRGSEAISAPFRFCLDLLAEAPVSFDALLGQPVSVRISVPGSPERYVNGVLASLEQGPRLQGPEGGVTFYRYQAEVVPRLWFLGLRTQCRIFQDQSVPQILAQVLHAEWGLDMRSQLTGSYPARDYCVQYRESDLDFVSRLMEEEGICYFFRHTKSTHTLVLADSADGHPDLEGESSLIFDHAEGGHRPEGRVTVWRKRQTVVSARYTLRDHSFQLPRNTLEASGSPPDRVQVGQVEHVLKPAPYPNGEGHLEKYDYPGRYAWHFDGVGRDGGDQAEQVQGLFRENQRVAHLRTEEETTHAVILDGQSLCGHLLPGYQFTLTRHFDGDGPYRLTRVEHTADLVSAYLSGAPAKALYENRFQASPAALPFRPPRVTPRPAISGVQTATVVGPKGNDIFVDRYGRVKVKFHWDRREGSGPESSCWLRVSQVWAGRRWGAYFWPRIGHEVVVAFVEGDPDRPLVTGSVYNEANMPPFALPDNRTLAGIKSFTSTGNPEAPADPLENYNGLVFDDTQGAEQLEIHGEKHIAFFGEKSHLHTIDGWHRLNVNGTHSVHVGGLPVGSGSGGGAMTDSKSPPFIYSKNVGSGRIGVNLASVFGIKQEVVLGANSDVTIGDKISIVNNPASMALDLGSGIPGAASYATGAIQGIAGLVGGNLDLIFGSNVKIGYGGSIDVLRGARARITSETNWRGTHDIPAIRVWTGIAECLAMVIASLSAASTTMLCLDSYSSKQELWLTMDEVLAGLAGGLSAVEVFVATFEQVHNTGYAANAGVLTQNVSSLLDQAALVANLVEPSTQGLSKGIYVQNTTAEYNGASRIIGAHESVMIFAGKDQGQQTAISLTSDMIRLASGKPLEGGRAFIQPNAVQINVGYSAVVQVIPDQILLRLGLSTALNMENGKITLTAGTNSLTISADEGITLKGPTTLLRLINPGQITLQATQLHLVGEEQVNLQAPSGNCTIPNFMLM